MIDPFTQIKASSPSSSMEVTLPSETHSQDQNLEFETPPFEQAIKRPSDSTIDLPTICTPDRLMVPKAFKYPERYRSPTDSMISPVTKGVLARHRRPATAAALLPPTLNRSHIPDLMIDAIIHQERGKSQFILMDQDNGEKAE